MPKSTNDQNQEISNDVKELVIARLDVLPPNTKVSIGSDGEFSKSELIERVKKGDSVGQQIIQIELSFLRALKDGVLLDEILKVDQRPA